MIRQANMDDLPAIMSMSENFVTDAEILMGYNSIDARDSIANMLTNKDCAIFVAEGGMLAAMLFPWLLNKKSITAVEVAWWVDKDKRKSGLGKELIAAFEGWAKERNASFLSMSSMKSSNMDIVSSFYERCGFSLHENTYVKRIS